MAKFIRVTAGETFSYSGVVSLPVGTWSCQCIAQNKKTGAFLTINASVTLVGPTTGKPGRNDWAVNIQASSTMTANWATNGQTHEAVSHLKFSDTSNPTVVIKTRQFPIIIDSWPSP